MVRRGPRFESVRGLCKRPANRGFCWWIELLQIQRAVGIEPFVEPPPPEELDNHVSSDNAAPFWGRCEEGAVDDVGEASSQQPQRLFKEYERAFMLVSP